VAAKVSWHGNYVTDTVCITIARACRRDICSVGGALSRAPDVVPVRRDQGHAVSHEGLLPAGPAHGLVLSSAPRLSQPDLRQHDVPADPARLPRRKHARLRQQNSLQVSQSQSSSNKYGSK